MDIFGSVRPKTNGGGVKLVGPAAVGLPRLLLAVEAVVEQAGALLEIRANQDKLAAILINAILPAGATLLVVVLMPIALTVKSALFPMAIVEEVKAAKPRKLNNIRAVLTTNVSGQSNQVIHAVAEMKIVSLPLPRQLQVAGQATVAILRASALPQPVVVSVPMIPVSRRLAAVSGYPHPPATAGPLATPDR
jgi:hypothetical protein